MAVYPEKILEFVLKPAFAARAVEANAVGTGANFGCGCFVRFRLSVDAGKKISAVGVDSNGCGYMLAAAEFLAERFEGKTLTELSVADGLGLIGGVNEALGEVPRERASCLRSSIEALESALADFRARQIEEFRGESPLICSCFGVTEDRIERLLSTGAASSVDDIARECNAGRGCGSCRMLIQELIESAKKV